MNSLDMLNPCKILLYISLLVTLVVPKGDSRPTFDVVVSRDGNGDYSKIMDAINKAPQFSIKRYHILIRAGVYAEYVVVPKNKPNLTFIGEGMSKTIITGDRSFVGGADDSSTVIIRGKNFVAMNITFENTAGAANGPAVAMRSNVQSAFYGCRFLGYQDTLCPSYDVQFYRECDIYGTIDFIFGFASVVFQKCNIYGRLPPPKSPKGITITAQGKDKRDIHSGFVFQNCNILPADDLTRSNSHVKVFFGRPWYQYSTTVVMQSYIDDVVDPLGWSRWGDDTSKDDTVFYAEYKNRGPGAATNKRVTWRGFHILDTNEAIKFTVRNFISGENWIPSLEIPFDLDLID